VGQFREARQQLANPHAGDARGDRLIRSPYFLLGIGLGVEAVDVTRAAVLNDEDARLLAGPGRGIVRRIGPQQFRQPEAKGADPADLEQLATGDSVASWRHRSSSDGCGPTEASCLGSG